MDTTRTDSDLTVEWVRLDALHPNPANPRMNDHAIDPVASSIRRFGWQQPIVAKAGGEVVAGHTRLKAAQKLGLERVPVVCFTGSDIDAVAFGIADSKTASIAEFDEPALGKLLAFLSDEDALDGVGFTEAELAVLLNPEPDEGDLDDVEPEDAPEDPVSRSGDLWLLGDHRLLVGDSTKPEDVDRLMGSRKADLVWTDPPFGVSYRGNAGTIQNDELTGDDLERFLGRALGLAFKHTRTGTTWYIAAPAGPQFLQWRVRR